MNRKHKTLRLDFLRKTFTSLTPISAARANFSALAAYIGVNDDVKVFLKNPVSFVLLLNTVSFSLVLMTDVKD